MARFYIYMKAHNAHFIRVKIAKLRAINPNVQSILKLNTRKLKRENSRLDLLNYYAQILFFLINRMNDAKLRFYLRR